MIVSRKNFRTKKLEYFMFYDTSSADNCRWGNSKYYAANLSPRDAKLLCRYLVLRMPRGYGELKIWNS